MNYKLDKPLLYLDNIELGYGEGQDYKPVIKNLSLIEHDVIIEGQNTGQVVALLGRSGRGKSTIIKALAGLKIPKIGHVVISGSKGEPQEVKEGDIGLVDQKYTLFRHKTVEEIFYYSLRKTSKPLLEKKKIIEEYLKEWGLEAHRSKYPCELSGGQRQRTAIIEQLLTSDQFMIFDEPFSGLDVGNIREVKKSFEKIRQTNDLNTIIFSTHDLNLAVELADSIYIVGFGDESKTFSTVVKHFDLKEMGLAWKEFGEGHRNLVKEIDKIMMSC